MEEPVTWRTFFTVFGMVFLAELGDKTQLAAMSFAAGGKNPWIVFAAAVIALVLVTAIGVAVGTGLSKVADPKLLRRLAGGVFIAVGIVMIWRG